MSHPRFSQIPDAMRPAMQGIIPTCMSTSDPEGEPNVTYISQVWYVDAKHLAISCQFFNKTTRNVRSNPTTSILTTCPATYAVWRIRARYVESRMSGPLFDEMEDNDRSDRADAEPAKASPDIEFNEQEVCKDSKNIRPMQYFLKFAVGDYPTHLSRRDAWSALNNEQRNNVCELTNCYNQKVKKVNKTEGC